MIIVWQQNVFSQSCNMLINLNLTMDADKSQMVEVFLNMIRTAQNKQEFMAKVHDFDIKFTAENTFTDSKQRSRSVQKLPTANLRPKNPFKTSAQDTEPVRQIARQTQQYPPSQSSFYQAGYPPVQPQVFSNMVPQPATKMQQPSQSRTQQNFYKEFAAGYPQGTDQSLPTFSKTMIGMSMANENIAHQKEYEYLKEQFFKPIAPNKYFAEEASIIRGQYNEGQALNMNQLGSSLSNEYSGLSHQNYADVRTQNHPIMPMYVQSRGNPFAKQ